MIYFLAPLFGFFARSWWTAALLGIAAAFVGEAIDAMILAQAKGVTVWDFSLKAGLLAAVNNSLLGATMAVGIYVIRKTGIFRPL